MVRMITPVELLTSRVHSASRGIGHGCQDAGAKTGVAFHMGGMFPPAPNGSDLRHMGSEVFRAVGERYPCMLYQILTGR
jgi:hypothetical protein